MLNPLRKTPRKYRVWALLLCGTGLYFFANVQRVAIPGSVFNLLQQELGVSAPGITALGSSFMYVYAFCQLGIGLLVDRYGGHRVIAFGALLFCLGALLLPFADSLTMLYFSRALTGLGASSLYLSLVREVLRAFNRDFTVMLAVMILVGYAGGIAANAPLVYCVHLAGWRSVMLGAALLSLLFYLLFLLAKATLKMPPVRTQPFSLAPFLAVLRKRHNRRLFLFTGINFGLYYVLQTVLGKKFLEDFCGMSSNRAALILSLMGLISAVAGLSFAIVSKMLGNRRQVFLRLVGLTSVTIFALLVLCLALDFRSPGIALLLCLLAGTASTSSIAVPLLRETNDEACTGVAVSLLNFCCYLPVAVLGNAVGLLMDLYPPQRQGDALVYGTQSYLAVFGSMLLLAAVVAWNAFHLRETLGKNLADSTF